SVVRPGSSPPYSSKSSAAAISEPASHLDPVPDLRHAGNLVSQLLGALELGGRPDLSVQRDDVAARVHTDVVDRDVAGADERVQDRRLGVGVGPSVDADHANAQLIDHVAHAG